MSQRGNKCPGLNEYHTFESGDCLNRCDHQCVPASVLVHIENQRRVDKHTGTYLSVTSLLGCLRQLYLERTIDYFVEPPKSWWSLRGSILHRLLENPGLVAQIEDMKAEVFRLLKRGEGNREDVMTRWLDIEAKLLDLATILPKYEIPNWQAETEYEYPVGKLDGEMVYLRGTIDVLRPETGELYDYKTIGDNGLSIIKDGAKKDHTLQFNMYRLLVERGYPVGQKETYKPITINKITAFYMTMMQVVRTGGLLSENTIWRVSDPTTHPNMVGEPLVLGENEKMVLKRGKRHINATPDDYELKKYKKFRLTYAVPEVPLMNLDEVEKIILDNAPILVYAFKHGKMPPMCNPEMRAWKCDNYCPDQIRQACDKHNLSTGEERVVQVDDTIPTEV
jgi:hypothetical protein